MDRAFDLTFDAMMAWNQVGLVLGGLVFLLIGGLLIAWFFYVRLTHVRVRGRVAAVCATGGKAQAEAPSKEEPEPTWGSFREEFKRSPGSGLIGLVFALLIVGIPLLFVGIGAYFAYDYLNLRMSGIETEAVVVRNVYESGSDGSTYRAVVSFKDRSGRTWEVRDSMGKGGSPIYREGEKVAVHYDAAHPEHIAVGGFWKNMILPLAFAGMGSLFLFLMFGGALTKKGGGQPQRRKADFAGEMYYPIYEYRARNGTTIRGEGDTGSNWLADKIPGSPVTLYVRRDEPDSIGTPGFLSLFFGLVFAAPGVAMIYIAFTGFETGIFTVLFGLGFLAAIGFKGKKYIKPPGERETKEGFRARKKREREEERKQGRILTAAEIGERLKAQDRQAGYWIPFLVLLAAGMIAGGVHLGEDMRAFLIGARGAQGEVVRVESVYNSSSDGSGYTYYPVVAFRTAAGEKLEFRDKVGSNPPLYKTGDVVNVLYDPADPHHAIIDRGLWNWMLSASLLLGGLIFMWAALRMAASVRARRNRL